MVRSTVIRPLLTVSYFLWIWILKKKKKKKKTKKQALNSRTVIRPLGWHALDFFHIWNQKICKGKKKKKKKNKQTKKLRRRRWQSRGCAKLKQQISNLAEIASHSFHLRSLLLFILLSSFSPSLSSFRGDCCGFSLCLGWFWILFFFFMFPMALVHVTWLGRIQSPSYTWLGRI